MGMKILIIEDSERLGRSVSLGLEELGHSTQVASDGHSGLEIAEQQDFDALVLDLLLPEIGGLEIIRRLRESGNTVHIIVTSVLDKVEARVKALNIGADDYLIKPYSFDELRARLLSSARPQASCTSLLVGEATVNTAYRDVFINDQPIKLTAREFSILEYLVRRRGRIVSKHRIAEYLGSQGKKSTPRVIEVLIHHIRKKFRDRGAPNPIQTRTGFGYIVE